MRASSQGLWTKWWLQLGRVQVFTQEHGRAVLGLVMLLCWSALFGCTATGGGPALPASRSALTGYLDALRKDHPAAAYGLLSTSLKQSLSIEQFSKQWQAMPQERAVQAAQLRTLLDGSSLQAALRRSASYALPTGGQLLLVPVSQQSSARWVLTDGDLQTLVAKTPEAALRQLIVAVEQRNYSALLRLLTASERQSLESELRERLDRLRATMAKQPPVEVTGDRARLLYDPRFFIELKREADGWRISEFN